MRAPSLLYMSFCMLMACKGSTFTKDAANSAKSGSTAIPSELGADNEDADESIALEPTSIGGAFLGCFVDRQIPPDQIKQLTAPADSLPVGCQTYQDPNFQRIAGRGNITVDRAVIETAAEKKDLTMVPVDNHPRWAWLTKVPASAVGSSIYFQVRAAAKAQPVQLRVELLDLLPSSTPALTAGSYKLRIKGTSMCLHGDPEWEWIPADDDEPGKAVTESLELIGCETSLNFRLSNFLTGWRLHVPNPTNTVCDPVNYVTELCKESCVDLEGFGLGNRFVLFACTKSVAAQSFQLMPGTRGAFRLQVNSRYMSIANKLIFPTTDIGQEIEIVSTAPIP